MPVGAAPIAQASDSVELAFREQATLSSDSLAAVVTRVDENLEHRFMAWLQTPEGVVSEWVEYEFASDSFVRSRDTHMIVPPRWRLANTSDTSLTLSRRRFNATDEQRNTTLRALGIDVEMPIDYALYGQLVRTPIPRLISSVWVGDSVLQGEFLEALAHNTRIARLSGYRYQILLSQQDPLVFERNMRLLRTRLKARSCSLWRLKVSFRRSPNQLITRNTRPPSQATAGSAATLPLRATSCATACSSTMAGFIWMPTIGCWTPPEVSSTHPWPP